MNNTMTYNIRKEKLLDFERALSTLEGYEGWMIGTCKVSMRWCGKDIAENDTTEKKLIPQIIKKGRSAVRVRISADAITEKNYYDAEEKEQDALQIQTGKAEDKQIKTRQVKDELIDEWMEVLLVKPRMEVLIHEKKEEITNTCRIGGNFTDMMTFSRIQMEEYLKEVSDTNPIHKGDKVVLPGFLVMNECLLHLAERDWIDDNRTTDEDKTIEVRFLSPLYPDEAVYLLESSEEEAKKVHLKSQLGDREILVIIQ